MAFVIGPEFYEESRGSTLPAPILDLVEENEAALDQIITSLTHALFEGFDLNDPDELRAVIKAARRKYERMADPVQYDRHARLDELARARAQLEDRSVVYYMRLGNRIKIGTTTNLKLRTQQIQPEEVLVTEPGGPQVEARRHHQFAKLRCSGEWFRADEPLLSHVGDLQESVRGRRQAG